MTTDFSRINPCGECCGFCGYYYDGGCGGCREDKAKGCEISDCCKEHHVYFCGVCRGFPCETIKNKYSEWNKDGIAKTAELGKEYNLLNRKGR